MNTNNEALNLDESDNESDNDKSNESDEDKCQTLTFQKKLCYLLD